MSWSLYFTARNEASAREYVQKQPVESPDNRFAMPQAARDLILAALDLARIGPDLAIKCEATGHSPGSAKVAIEAIALV